MMGGLPPGRMTGEMSFSGIRQYATSDRSLRGGRFPHLTAMIDFLRAWLHYPSTLPSLFFTSENRTALSHPCEILEAYKKLKQTEKDKEKK